MDKRKIKNKVSILKRTHKEKLVWFVIGTIVGVFLSVGVTDFIINPAVDNSNKENIKIAVASTINLLDLNFSIQGKFTTFNGGYEPTLYKNEKLGINYCELILPPIPKKISPFNFFTGTVNLSEECSIKDEIYQTIFIYNEGNKVEDFYLKISYGYPILEVDGEGSLSLLDNSVIIKMPYILPDVSFSQDSCPLTTVILDIDNTINVSMIIQKIEAKYYTKGTVNSYWTKIPDENVLHMGRFVTNYEQPNEIFAKLLNNRIKINER